MQYNALMMDRVELLGVEIDNLTRAEALERLRGMIRSGGAHQVVTPAIEQVMRARRNAGFRGVLQRADLVVPDGMPLIFASRWVGAPLRERITGVDLVPQLCRIATEENVSVFFFGAAEGVADETATVLHEQFPSLQVAGTCSPPMGFYDNEAQNREAIRRIREAAPGVLFVAISSPMAEIWIDRHKEELGVPVIIGIGGAFNFITGREKRAPGWLQEIGLESLYRFIQRPRAILSRLLVNAPSFFALLIDLLTYRLQKRATRWLRPLVLGTGDAILASLCFLFSYWMYFRSGWFGDTADPYPDFSLLNMPAYSDLLNVVAVVGIAALWFQNLYERNKYLSVGRVVLRSFRAAIIGVLMLIGVTFLFKDLFFAEAFRGFSRVVFAGFGLTFFVVVCAWRLGFRWLEHTLHRRGFHLDRIIIVGDTEVAHHLADTLIHQPQLGNKPIGFVVPDASPDEHHERAPLLGGIADLQRLLPARKIDEVLIADPDLSPEDIHQLVSLCLQHGVALSIVPSIHELLGLSSEVKQVGSYPVITVALEKHISPLMNPPAERAP